MSEDLETAAMREARTQRDRARIWFIPVRGRTSSEVHATTIASAPRTGCNKRLRRSVVASTPLTCVHCMIAVGLRVPVLRLKNKPKSKRARKRRR